MNIYLFQAGISLNVAPGNNNLPPPVKNIATFSKLCHDNMEFPNTLMKTATTIIILKTVWTTANQWS